jgi:hypothetical protein
VGVTFTGPCGECEECHAGLTCQDSRLTDCCEREIADAVNECLDDFSEGMADPELKAYVVYAVSRALTLHSCDPSWKFP